MDIPKVIKTGNIPVQEDSPKIYGNSSIEQAQAILDNRRDMVDTREDTSMFRSWNPLTWF